MTYHLTIDVDEARYAGTAYIWHCPLCSPSIAPELVDGDKQYVTTRSKTHLIYEHDILAPIQIDYRDICAEKDCEEERMSLWQRMLTRLRR